MLEETLTVEQGALLPDEMLESWKEFASAAGRLQRISRQIGKAAERWDLRLLRQRLPEAAQLAQDVAAAAQRADVLLSGWTAQDAPAGLGAYAEAIERAAQQLRLPLQGAFPEYEVFPLKIALDLSSEQATVSRRRTSTLEPQALLREVQARHQALHRSSFNQNRFMKALTAAHKLLRQAGGSKSMDVSLLAIHEVLTMRSGAGDYTKSEFAFDIYRLRRESDMVYDHQKLSFLNGRSGNLAVPNAKGGTDALGILRLVKVEDDV